MGVDIAGTRMVYHLLQYQTEFRSDTIKGIMELSPNDMELLVKDPFASRCIFDELMKSTQDSSSQGSTMLTRKRLVTKLQNRWVGIATDRVGHHMVKQLFFSLDDMNDRKGIVDELIIGKNRMNSNSMGRNVLEALHVRIYETNGENEWINTMKRQLSKQDWLTEIIDTKKGKTLNDSSVEHNVTDNGSGTTTKKKGNAAMTMNMHDMNTKKKQRVSKSVDTIMDAISIPTQQ